MCTKIVTFVTAQVQHVAREIKLPQVKRRGDWWWNETEGVCCCCCLQEEVERKLSRLILDKSLNGKFDTLFHTWFGIKTHVSHHTSVHGMWIYHAIHWVFFISVCVCPCFSSDSLKPKTHQAAHYSCDLCLLVGSLSLVCGRFRVCKLDLLVLLWLLDCTVPPWLCHLAECVFGKRCSITRARPPFHTCPLSLSLSLSLSLTYLSLSLSLLRTSFRNPWSRARSPDCLRK